MATSSRNDTAKRRSAEILYHLGEFEELIEEYNDRNPAMQVTGENRSDISLTTKCRILAGDPPDLWSGWPGQNVQPYHEAGALGDVSDVWTAEMERNFEDVAIEASRFDDSYRALPVSINRVNHLYYSHEVVESAGVDPDRIRDPHEFVEVLAQMDDVIDGPPILVPLRSDFTSVTLQLWETLLLGVSDASTYRAVIGGDARAHRDSIREATDVLRGVFEYMNDDAPILGVGAAAHDFADDEAGFLNQLTWVGVVLPSQDFEYERDWGHVPVPGTDGIFDVNMDAFMLAADAENPENARSFLRYLGSAETMAAMNDGGSISPRTDISTDALSSFVRDQFQGFRRAESQVPSIAHGLALKPETLIDLQLVFTQFAETRDVDSTVREAVAVLTDAE